jgi:hypothetical protein
MASFGDSRLLSRLFGRPVLVGARNSAALCDLPVFVDGSAESVPSDDLDLCTRWRGEWSQRRGLSKRSVWPVDVEMGFVLCEDLA